MRDDMIGPARLKGGSLQLLVDEVTWDTRGPRSNIYKFSGSKGFRYLFEGKGWSRKKQSERLFDLRNNTIWRSGMAVGKLQGSKVEVGEQAFELGIPAGEGERVLTVVQGGRVLTAIEVDRSCPMEPEPIRSALALFCAWRTLRWPERADELAPS